MKRLYYRFALFLLSFIFNILVYNFLYARRLINNYTMITCMGLVFITLALFLIEAVHLENTKELTGEEISQLQEKVIRRKEAFMKVRPFVKKFNKNDVLGNIEIENQYVNLYLSAYRGYIFVTDLTNNTEKILEMDSNLASRVTDAIIMRFDENTKAVDVFILYSELAIPEENS